MNKISLMKMAAACLTVLFSHTSLAMSQAPLDDKVCTAAEFGVVTETEAPLHVDGQFIKDSQGWTVLLRGIGMVWGLDIPRSGFASMVSREAFGKNLIIELAGADDNVVKFLPALTIDEETLRQGIAIIDQAISDLLAHSDDMRKGASA